MVIFFLLACVEGLSPTEASTSTPLDVWHPVVNPVVLSGTGYLPGLWVSSPAPGVTCVLAYGGADLLSCVATPEVGP